MKPSPYIVSLIQETTEQTTEPMIETPEAPTSTRLTAQTKQTMQPVKQQKKIETVTDINRAEERIAELQAKKKLESLVRLRSIIDVKKSSQSSTVSSTETNTNTPKPTNHPQPGYYDLVQAKIRQNWIYPESLDRDLETVISIKIAKDGTATVLGIERSSGNRLFDRSVLIAITKASPLPKPINEIEIGVRFRP